jgi:PEGA domain-containing protein
MACTTACSKEAEMTRLALVAALAVVLAARISAAEDKAKSRGGSSSSSSAGARHPSPSSSSSSSKSSSSNSSSSDKSDSGTTSSSSNSSTPTPAQRRHPRAGTGTGHYPDHGSYYGDGYYPSFYFGYPAYYYSAWYPGYYGYAAAPYSVVYGYQDTGSLRVMVEPAKTRVFVDGYYAGTADDFDGMFQRLHVSAGRHEITLKLDGYRTHRFRVYVPVGHTVKLRHDMARGAGEDAEDLAGEGGEARGGPAGYARLEDEPKDARAGDPRGAMPADTGRIHVDVRPPDASIYIDGVFRGPARAMDGVLLPSGRHRVEIVRPGYRTDQREIEVRSGETTDLRADLERLS